MKVLYDYQAFSRQFYGGVSRYFVELARHLAATPGTDARIVAPLYINRYLNELGNAVVVGRQVTRGPKAIGRLLNVYNRMRLQSCARSFQPDIVHETYFQKKPVSVPGARARVVSVYDMIHERFPEHFAGWDRTSANKKAAVDRADHVICISETTRRDLIDIFGTNPQKVSVTHLGFDVGHKGGETKDLAPGDPFLLYVGVRSGYKNFSRLLAAYASRQQLVEGFRLVCFGGGPFSKTELMAHEKLRLPADRVIWLGGNDSVLSALYSRAAAFVYPSLYEGFGIPPLEAMAHECPVICSSGGSISEIVSFAGEYFDPLDEESIAAAVEKVVDSAGEADRLRGLGRRRIQDFSWEQCARQTHAVYSGLL